MSDVNDFIENSIITFKRLYSLKLEIQNQKQAY